MIKIFLTSFASHAFYLLNPPPLNFWIHHCYTPQFILEFQKIFILKTVYVASQLRFNYEKLFYITMWSANACDIFLFSRTNWLWKTEYMQKEYVKQYSNMTYTVHACIVADNFKSKKNSYSFSSEFRKPANENSSNYTTSNYSYYNEEWKIKEERSHSVHGEWRYRLGIISVRNSLYEIEWNTLLAAPKLQNPLRKYIHV